MDKFLTQGLGTTDMQVQKQFISQLHSIVQIIKQRTK
jgi:hypothetical protein